MATAETVITIPSGSDVRETLFTTAVNRTDLGYDLAAE